jgi:hypothetical protein
LGARNLRLLAEQRLVEAELAHHIERQRLDELRLCFATRHSFRVGAGPAYLSTEDEVMFTHPDLIDLDLADAYWRPE